MNLLTEYQKRHGTICIPTCHDGFCFFNDKKGKPSLIVTTNLACRSFSTCYQCEAPNPNIILEIFSQGDNPGSFILLGHHHIDMASDLFSAIKSMGYKDYVPFYAKKARDLEVWLWKFCSKNTKIRGLKPTEEDENLQVIEQMIYSCQKNSKFYLAYHMAYEAFLPSRRYMLFE